MIEFLEEKVISFYYIFWTIMFILQQGFSLDPQQYVPTLVSTVVTVVLFIVVFAFIYIVGKSFMTRAVKESLSRRGFDEALIGVAVSITSIVIAVVAVSLAATIAGFGVVLSAFAILGGALALAVGFATQDLISNFVAGIFIIRDKPFTVGDWIEWNGNSGVVREIKLRVTKLDTFDNELVTVPNSDLANSAVINNIANDKRRISVGFGIGYSDDIEQARKAILDEASKIDEVLEEPKPSAPVTELGDSAVVLSGRIWINPKETSIGKTRSKFLESVKNRFDQQDIDMPYPNTEISGRIDINKTDEN